MTWQQYLAQYAAWLELLAAEMQRLGGDWMRALGLTPQEEA